MRLASARQGAPQTRASARRPSNEAPQTTHRLTGASQVRAPPLTLLQPCYRSRSCLLQNCYRDILSLGESAASRFAAFVGPRANNPPRDCGFRGSSLLQLLAERVGFEPTRRFDPPTRFPVAHLKPLGHLSGRPDDSADLVY